MGYGQENYDDDSHTNIDIIFLFFTVNYLRLDVKELHDDKKLQQTNCCNFLSILGFVCV